MDDQTQAPPAVADSMAQAVALSGLPMAVLKWAKNRGCPAFKDSRVRIPELQAWVKENEARLNEEDAGGQMDKERADILLKLARLEEQNLLNAKLRGELQPISAICDKMRAVSEEIKGTLRMRMIDQLPAQNAGLDAPKQRENNRAAFEEICKRFQAWAHEYDQILSNNEQQKQQQQSATRLEAAAVALACLALMAAFYAVANWGNLCW